MMDEFKKGDVVVRIGGSNAYVIDGAYQTTIWYSAQYLWNGKLFQTHVHRTTIDSDYVKVDFCRNPFDDKSVYEKLMPIAKAFGKWGTNERIQEE
jgi:hypothetical protein